MQSIAAFPREVLPSKKETEPAGVPVVVLKTAAVNVTCCPEAAGFTSAVTVVFVEIPNSAKT